MPSTRPHPLNPRLPATPSTYPVTAGTSEQASQVLAALPAALAPSSAPAALVPVPEGDSPAVKAARAGGFHESSYELQHGLQVSESEWPDDVTIPGVLGER